jgi:hypothetical protein
MLWEHEGKRGYQFEDGKLRVIAEAYFDLLQPAIKPDPVVRSQLHEQARQNGFLPRGTASRGTRSARAPSTPQPNLEDQIEVFESLFPGGFDDTGWIEQVRGKAGARRKKTYRDPAIADAREQLAKQALEACIEAGRHAEVFDRVLGVLRRTDLVNKSQLAALEGLDVDRELAEAMVAYLHDIRESALEPMARLRRALARHDVRKLAWNALTAPRALLYPADHMCVRPTTLRAQAKLTSPRFRPGAAPSAADYSRCLELAMGVREQLSKENFTPRDLFDVIAFMRVTLAAKVKPQLLEAMARRRAVEGPDKGPDKPASQ